MGEEDIQKGKGAILFHLHCELDMLIDAVEMVIKGCDGFCGHGITSVVNISLLKA